MNNFETTAEENGIVCALAYTIWNPTEEQMRAFEQPKLVSVPVKSETYDCAIDLFIATDLENDRVEIACGLDDAMIFAESAINMEFNKLGANDD